MLYVRDEKCQVNDVQVKDHYVVFPCEYMAGYGCKIVASIYIMAHLVRIDIIKAIL